jgi:phosphoribosylformimino-5-aminoimidazole carboxamide ribonucleotide (ProFAR) isomerase
MLEILPELPVSGGNVVRRRLAPGAPTRVVSVDPLAVARGYAEEGSDAVLLTDLDGLEAGAPAALALATLLSAEAGLEVTYRGGLQSAADIDRAGEAGVSRFVLDRVAFGDAAVLRWAVDRLGSRLLVALDADGDQVRLPRGQQGPLDLADAAGELAYRGVEAFLHTDLGVAGTLTGPAEASLARLLEAVACPVVYAGGVATAGDVRRLATLGHANLRAVSIATALHEGRLSVAEARAAAANPTSEEREP